jgi:hypothetical protein
MKRASWLLGVVALILVCGCRTRYDITLNTGNKITSVGKPKLVEGSYVYKDALGQQGRVSVLRVRSIEPQRRGWSEEPTFTPAR